MEKRKSQLPVLTWVCFWVPQATDLCIHPPPVPYSLDYCSCVVRCKLKQCESFSIFLFFFKNCFGCSSSCVLSTLPPFFPLSKITSAWFSWPVNSHLPFLQGFFFFLFLTLVVSYLSLFVFFTLLLRIKFSLDFSPIVYLFFFSKFEWKTNPF